MAKAVFTRTGFIANTLLTSTFIFVPSISVAAGIEDTSATIGLRAGQNYAESYVDFIVPFYASDTFNYFVNPRLAIADEGGSEFNIGVGARFLIADKGVFGAGVFLDKRESAAGFDYDQWGLSLEWLTDNYDVRFNSYESDDDLNVVNNFSTLERRVDELFFERTTTSEQIARSVTEIGGDFRPTGHSLSQKVTTNTTTTTRYTTLVERIRETDTIELGRQFNQFESVLDGWDAEIGFKLPFEKGPQVKLYAGYYDYDHPFNQFGVDDISGGKARVEVRSGKALTFDAEYYEDSFSGSDYFVGLRLEVPLKRKGFFKTLKDNLRSSPKRSLRERMFSEVVVRDTRVHLDISEPQEDIRQRTFAQQRNREVTLVDRRVDEITETEMQMSERVLRDDLTFVDNDNGGVGDGTFENPYASVQDGVTNAGDNTTIFVCAPNSGGSGCNLADAGGSYNLAADGAVTLQPNQVITSSIEGAGGTRFETDVAPALLQTTGAAVLIANSGSNNTINRLSLRSTGNNRDGVQINNSGGAGVTTITNNTLATSGNNAMGIDVVNGVSGTIIARGNTINTSGSGSRGFDATNTTASFTIEDNTIATSGNGARAIDAANTTGSISINRNTLTTTTNNADGIELTNTTGSVVANNNSITTQGSGARGIQSSTSGSFTATGNTIATNDNNGQGIDINAVTGAVTASNNTVTTMGVNSDGLEITNVSATVTASNNTVTTQGNNNNSRGIQTNNIGSLIASNNVLTTSGNNSQGIDANNTMGSLVAQNNNITTTGNNADGFEITNTTGSMNVSGNTVTTGANGARGADFINNTGALTANSNTITTTGNNARGIDIDRNDGAVSVSGNTISTNGTNAYAIYTERTTAGSNVGISSNTVTTMGTGARAIWSRDTADAQVSISGNTVTTSGASARGIQVDTRGADTRQAMMIGVNRTVSNNTVTTGGANAHGLVARDNSPGPLANGQSLCLQATGNTFTVNNAGANIVRTERRPGVSQGSLADIAAANNNFDVGRIGQANGAAHLNCTP